METLATFTKPEEAHLLRMRLAAVGIPAVLQNEHTVQIDALLSPVLGGVELQVADEDLEPARQFLRESEGQADGRAANVCPQCGVPDGEQAPATVATKLFTLLALLLPGARVGQRWHCPHCQATWKR